MSWTNNYARDRQKDRDREKERESEKEIEREYYAAILFRKGLKFIQNAHSDACLDGQLL